MLLVENGKILLVKRGRDPYIGHYALPGGFVEYGEKTEEAAIREMKEETGLDVKITYLIGVYSDPARDPRGHTVSVVYEVKRISGNLSSGDDATEAAFFSLSKLPALAFDHKKIVQDYLLLHRI
jgi:8-oxo-dGTP diphosphatase